MSVPKVDCRKIPLLFCVKKILIFKQCICRHICHDMLAVAAMFRQQQQQQQRIVLKSTLLCFILFSGSVDHCSDHNHCCLQLSVFSLSLFLSLYWRRSQIEGNGAFLVFRKCFSSLPSSLLTNCWN